MGRMSKRWHSWLIEHVRSIETFATVVFDGSDETIGIISYIVLSRNLKTLLRNHRMYQALDLKEGEAEAIFEELISKESMDEHNSSLIQFHIKLLALILSDSEKE
ncbi:uncharacterized protein LOC114181542 isoform X2 [Vigna unguiculata]|nr:uncharacterized protein LOC114181542 isoform X2 [Vigna unguiculata]